MKRLADPGALAASAVALALLLASPLEAQFVAQGGKLVGSGGVGTPHQATSVAVSADGNTLIVGGPLDNNSVGATWVFTRSAGAWTQQARLIAADAIGPSAQGTSVALSADGNTAIVGGPADNGYVGAACVWTRSGGRLEAPGLEAGGDRRRRLGTAGLRDRPLGRWQHRRHGRAFRQSSGRRRLGLHPVGDDVDAAGAEAVRELHAPRSRRRDGPARGMRSRFRPTATRSSSEGPGPRTLPARAWVFARSHGVWLQQGPRLVGTGGAGDANQGQSVALSGDGNTALVGGPADSANRGAVWVFTRSAGVWSQEGLRHRGYGGRR